MELGTGGRRGGLDREHADGATREQRLEADRADAELGRELGRDALVVLRVARSRPAWDSSSTVQANGSVSSGVSAHASSSVSSPGVSVA